MVQVFTLNISLPDTVDVPKLVLGVRDILGEAEGGLTDKQAGELAASNYFFGLYLRQVQRVDFAIATASDRAEIETCQDTIRDKNVIIAATKQALRAAAEAEWA